VEIVEMDDEELYVAEDVLEAARIGKIYECMKTSECKTVSESEVDEKETLIHWQLWIQITNPISRNRTNILTTPCPAYFASLI
jgi:hypothetical protein